MSGPGWYDDPSGRFEHRYHNGTAWTADVASGGRRFVDPYRPLPPPSNGTAVAALVLGVVATALGWLPFVAVLMIVAAVVAIVLGAVARRRASSGTGRAFASWGLALGIVAVPVSVLGLFVTGWFVRAFERYDQPNPHTIEITSCREDGDRVIAEGWIVNDGRDAASFTVRVALSHDADGGRPTTDRVEVDDLGPGERASWRAAALPDGFPEGTPDCNVRSVHGPLPFGFDPGE